MEMETEIRQIVSDFGIDVATKKMVCKQYCQLKGRGKLSTAEKGEIHYVLGQIIEELITNPKASICDEVEKREHYQDNGLNDNEQNGESLERIKGREEKEQSSCDDNRKDVEKERRHKFNSSDKKNVRKDREKLTLSRKKKKKKGSVIRKSSEHEDSDDDDELPLANVKKRLTHIKPHEVMRMVQESDYADASSDADFSSPCKTPIKMSRTELFQESPLVKQKRATKKKLVLSSDSDDDSDFQDNCTLSEACDTPVSKAGVGSCPEDSASNDECHRNDSYINADVDTVKKDIPSDSDCANSVNSNVPSDSDCANSVNSNVPSDSDCANSVNSNVPSDSDCANSVKSNEECEKHDSHSDDSDSGESSRKSDIHVGHCKVVLTDFKKSKSYLDQKDNVGGHKMVFGKKKKSLHKDSDFVSRKRELSSSSDDSDIVLSRLKDKTTQGSKQSKESSKPPVFSNSKENQMEKSQNLLRVKKPESKALKDLRAICRHIGQILRNTIELKDCDTDEEKVSRIKVLLREKGMKGRPCMKSAEQFNLERELKELGAVTRDSPSPVKKRPRKRVCRDNFFSEENSSPSAPVEACDNFSHMKDIFCADDSSD